MSSMSRWTANMVASLPQLRCFELLGDDCCIWSKELVSKLPRTLTKCVFSPAHMLTEAFGSLPHGLETLVLHSAKAPTDDERNSPDHLSLLPRSLRHFTSDYLQNVEDRHIALLPPRLLTLTFGSAPKLTPNVLRFLPLHCELTDCMEESIVLAIYKVQKSLSHKPLADPDPRIGGQSGNEFFNAVTQ